MKFELTKTPIDKIKADMVFAIKGDESYKTLDKALDGNIKKIVEKEAFAGKEGESLLIYTHGKIPASIVVVIGIGEVKDLTLDKIRNFGATIVKIANKHKVASIASVLDARTVKGFTPKDRASAFIEGAVLGGYKFNRYKDPKGVTKNTLTTIYDIYAGPAAALKKAIDESFIIANAVNYARELTNLPGSDLTPQDLAKEAGLVAKEFGFKIETLDKAAILKKGLRLIEAVGRASEKPPVFIHLTYVPKKKTATRLAFVGKGVTFDSGGMNFKTSAYMKNMNGDMAAAAIMLGVMKVIGTLKPSVQVDVYIPTLENMLSGNAMRTGDIIKSYNGKTVEVTNTDAEGRLILADAIAYAADAKPTEIIDVGTISGSAVYVAGDRFMIAVATKDPLTSRLIKTAEKAGEHMWNLPLVEEYKEKLLKGPADLVNSVAGPKPDVIMTALFLREFSGGIPHAHIDISACDWREDENGYLGKGPTGTGLRTLVRYIMER